MKLLNMYILSEISVLIPPIKSLIYEFDLINAKREPINNNFEVTSLEL